MNPAKRMQLVGDEIPEMKSDGEANQNDWSNLPYTIIHKIAKVDIQTVIVLCHCQNVPEWQ